MKVLDCTLRDGGYYTNWNFDHTMVRDMVDSLIRTKVDIIELGYKFPTLTKGDFGRCDDAFIKSLLDMTHKNKYCFMIDLKDYLKNGKLDTSLLDKHILPEKDSAFSWCRIAMVPSQKKESLNAIDYFHSKGYKVCINIMRITFLTPEEIKQIGEFYKNSPIEVLYFADSFGSMFPDTVQDIIKGLKSSGKKIGIHTHDNMGLAFANTLKAIECGVSFVDGTITGMGRGVGNLRLEQILMFLEFKTDKDVLHKRLNRIIDEYFEPLKRKYGWGYSNNYMLTGLKSIHPTYCQVLQTSGIEDNSVKKALLRLKGDKKNDYNIENIQEYLERKEVIIIPARYESSRLPGKPLIDIKGKSLIRRVWERCIMALPPDRVYVATDDVRIEKHCQDQGIQTIYTPKDMLTGTDRVYNAYTKIEADIIINVQGDEPLISPDDIIKVIQSFKKFPKYVHCGMCKIENETDYRNPNIPKMVHTPDGMMLYGSRASIPTTKKLEFSHAMRQVCIYAFPKDALESFANHKTKTPLEQVEDIEILRFAELGYNIKLVEVSGQSISVDVLDDVNKVVSYLDKHGLE